MSVIKKLIPTKIKEAYRSKFPDWKGGNHYCNVCDTQVAYFNPFPQFYYDLWEKHGFEKGDKQETLNVKAYQCPSCRCADRDRLAIFHFNKWAANKSDLDILEFAPIIPMQNYLKGFDKVKSYRSADIQSELADDKVDICNMSESYNDVSFDFIYCSHVLEHVEDDLKALKEIRRILKPGGAAFLYVPIFTELNEIYEDESIQSEEDRWKHFGQNDHVRLYNSSGFSSRIEEAGFKLEKVVASSIDQIELDKIGISNTSVLYVAHK